MADSMTSLAVSVDKGFEGIHERQDTTNGKVLKANDDITKLSFEFKYNRIIWYMLTVSVSVIIALASYILLKSHN